MSQSIGKDNIGKMASLRSFSLPLIVEWILM